MNKKQTIIESPVSNNESQSSSAYPSNGSSLGKYTDLKLIGEGGQAAVFSAKDSTLGDRVVALKVSRKSLTGNSEDIERFRREINLQAKLDIPRCVKIYDCGEDQGWLFFSMELVDGKTLGEIFINDISIPERITIIQRIAEILSELHKQKLTHRDIKLQNIMIDSRNEVRLLDFGLTKTTSSYPKDMFQTQEGIFSGTPASTAPEFTGGDNKLSYSAEKGDIFALGILAYELLSGKYPFEIDGLEVEEALEVIRTEEPLSLSKVVPALPKIIYSSVMKTLSKKPSERPSAAEFAENMQKGLNEIRKSPLIKKLLAVCAGILIASVIIIVMMRESETSVSGKADKTTTFFSKATSTPLFTELFQMGINLAKIQPGEFNMGSDNGDSDEKPIHLVTLKDKFWISKTEITEEQYNRIMNPDSQSKSDSLHSGKVACAIPAQIAKKNLRSENASYSKTADSRVFDKHHENYNDERASVIRKTHEGQKTDRPSLSPIALEQHKLRTPITDISWNEAEKFCRILTKMMANKLPKGYIFRLPTEAEWEYCCRAGGTTEFSCGNMEDELASFAVFGIAEDRATTPDEARSTKSKYKRGFASCVVLTPPSPVATKTANAFGLYDMHGNVWEWCMDSKRKYTQSSLVNPVGNLSAPTRIARGGCYESSASACRSANRIEHQKSYKNRNLGFRIVLGKVIIK